MSSAPEKSGFEPLKKEEGEPVFDEAWQAQVLALAYGLADRGVFSPAEWSETLGAELRKADAAGKPDDQHTYYAAALAALESLLERQEAIPEQLLDARVEEWRRAYLNTPHGEPVELAAGLKD